MSDPMHSKILEQWQVCNPQNKFNNLFIMPVGWASSKVKITEGLPEMKGVSPGCSYEFCQMRIDSLVDRKYKMLQQTCLPSKPLYVSLQHQCQECVFSSASVIVNTLSPKHVDMLLFLNKKMTCETI